MADDKCRMCRKGDTRAALARAEGRDPGAERPDGRHGVGRGAGARPADDERDGTRCDAGSMLNLGVLAHVDAGETSLTERLLFECGASRHIGSVDEDTTQTDSNAIERARGITVRAAVACFRDKDLQFNLVDTPGHADFVAEVERGPMAVDTVILVPSAPEGVQPQIGALYRVIERLRLPAVVFVNKLDCVGAAGPEVLDELSGKPGLLPLATRVPVYPRTPEAGFAPAELSGADIRRQWAERLAENDEKLLEQLVADRCPGRAELRAQTNAGLLQPVVFGSSITGAGMDGLRSVLRELLEPPSDGPDLSASVFAIGRNERGERNAPVRCFGGTLAERQQMDVHQTDGSFFRDRVRNLHVVAPHGEGHRRGGPGARRVLLRPSPGRATRSGRWPTWTASAEADCGAGPRGAAARHRGSALSSAGQAVGAHSWPASSAASLPR